MSDELKEWKELALKLGGVLKTVKKENTDEWMEYCDKVIAKAEAKVAALMSEDEVRIYPCLGLAVRLTLPKGRHNLILTSLGEFDHNGKFEVILPYRMEAH